MPSGRVAALPDGRRHFVEIARVLVGGPAAILLDEPATGLTDAERERLAGLVRRVAADGALIVLVEHDLELVGRLRDVVTVIEYGRRIGVGGLLVERNVEVALSVASRASVLTRGGLAPSGTSAEVRASPGLHDAYPRRLPRPLASNPAPNSQRSPPSDSTERNRTGPAP